MITDRLSVRTGTGPNPEAGLSDVYTELRQLARRFMDRERVGHTLDPTALVHEAYLRLSKGGRKTVDRNELLAQAAVIMRQTLVDHARRHRAQKRSGSRKRQPLEETVASYEESASDLIELDDALKRLTDHDAQLARIIELRFFGRMTVEETAEALGVSVSTVVRGWRFARLWLFNELGRGEIDVP